MNIFDFEFAGAKLQAHGSGALFWPMERLLVVSDLHLGKSERVARRSGQLLPPYEGIDTLTRLDEAIAQTAPEHVICLGDSFDDLDAGRRLSAELGSWLTRLMAGRLWTWIEGNHDPGPLEFGGAHRAELTVGPLVFRHIATPGGGGEVSGHYHPKARLTLRGRSLTRACFLRDKSHLILPAFGTYTGGLRSSDAALTSLMAPDATAILTGQTLCEMPMPR